MERASVAELRAALGGGAIRARDLVRACLDRIDALDRTGPNLRAVIELNPDAVAIAGELDAELANGHSRGPLHGIPVLLKDNIATADQMQTTAGSLALAGVEVSRDAFVTARLRAAGAVILGKTNLSEWANIRSPRSTSGWSGRGGQTVNPHQLDRNPSGSSSGSAVAVAAGYAPLAIGTETNGSIIAPANACGIVGIKPTVGLTSRVGVIPISHSQDTVGPMARSVADAAALLTVIAGVDPEDPAHGGPGGSGEFPTTEVEGYGQPDYLAALDHDGLRGARIGVPRALFGFSRAADAITDRALAFMREAGAEIVDPVDLQAAPEIDWDDELAVMLTELKPGLAAWLAGFAPSCPISSLADIIRFNENHPREEMPFFRQEYFHRAEETGGLDDPAYLASLARNQRRSRQGGLDKVIEEHRLDALVAPTGAPAPKLDLINGDWHPGGSGGLSALAGYPIVTVPAGFAFGMPVNISFMGTAYSEATLIRLAYAYEQASCAFAPPSFLAGSVLPPALV
jgi:amidase